MRRSEPHVLRYMHMRRTSILLDPGLLAELERIARREGRPTAHVIREALERYVADRPEDQRGLPGFIGLGAGAGPGDVALNARVLVADEIRERLQRQRGDRRG